MGYEERDYYRDEEQMFGRPSFDKKTMVFLLIMINVGVFVLDMFSSELANPADGTRWLSWFLAIKLDSLWEVWTLLTHGFAHASMGTDLGIMHILGNMFTLFFLGGPVEQRLGRMGFLWFYLCSIVVGGLVWVVLSLPFGSAGFIVGASGAVSAVVGYFIFMAPKAQLLLFGIVPVRAWALGVILLVLNMFHAFSPDSHVAWQAHLGGAAFGWACFHFGWNFSQFEGISKLFAGGTKLRVHDPDAAEEKLKEQADQILAKISDEGEASLSSKERRLLKKYSNRLRKNRPS